MSWTSLRAIGNKLLKTPEGKKLCTDLDTSGSFRTLFDNCSTEWKMSTVQEKRKLLERLAKFVTIDKLKAAFKDAYCHRPDIVACVERSLEEITRIE
jgi:hypothetical protein